jgi:hypothetical protein
VDRATQASCIALVVCAPIVHLAGNTPHPAAWCIAATCCHIHYNQTHLCRYLHASFAPLRVGVLFWAAASQAHVYYTCSSINPSLHQTSCFAASSGLPWSPLHPCTACAARQAASDVCIAWNTFDELRPCVFAAQKRLHVFPVSFSSVCAVAVPLG